MKVYIFVALLLGLQVVASVMHSWKAFYTATTGMSEFPEFVALNLVDDELMGYFDSKTNRFEGKQSWVMENLGQEYVEQETNILRGVEQTFKANIGVAMKRFNQTQGVHINQRMYGCEWDDETNEVKGFFQDGFDAKDFLSLDMKNKEWVAPAPQAVLTKNKWDNDKGWNAQLEAYFSDQCLDWLKKYLNYGMRSLMRTETPSVSLLQKSSTSPVSCHATGFYPNRAEMFWRKNGEEIHDGVVKGEILPNNDGTFQMSAHIDLSSDTFEDGKNYECVFQLSGVKEDKITLLDKIKIKTNEPKSNLMIIPIIIAVAVLVLIAVVGVILYKKKIGKRPPSPAENREVQQQMLPDP